MKNASKKYTLNLNTETDSFIKTSETLTVKYCVKKSKNTASKELYKWVDLYQEIKSVNDNPNPGRCNTLKMDKNL